MAAENTSKPVSARPTTRAGRRARQAATLPGRFEPKFIETTDQRNRAVRLIRQRLERLKEEANCDSFQKEMLAEQAIFIAVQLETMKVNALEGLGFNPGSFTQMVNCLTGILGKIGLERHIETINGDLTTYLARQRAGGDE